MLKRILVALAAAMTLLAAGFAPNADAARPPDPGSELGNNLSVPAIFVPGPGAFAVTCPGGPTDPTGTPLDLAEYEIEGYFYVQGVHTWQAECTTALAGTVTATADWGDNLEGTSLKAGTPIRVEVGLMDSSASMDGYVVDKLQPSQLDRVSAYGTLATPLPTDPVTYAATQTTFPYTDPVTGLPVEVRVYDDDATFSLYNDTTDTFVVPAGTPMSAEINSKGAIVFGYNWGVGGHGVKSLPTAGDYILTFTAPNVTLDNPGVSADGHTVTLSFTVATKNNGGGGGAGHGR